MGCTSHLLTFQSCCVAEHVSASRYVLDVRRGRTCQPGHPGRLQRIPLLVVLGDALPRRVRLPNHRGLYGVVLATFAQHMVPAIQSVR